MTCGLMLFFAVVALVVLWMGWLFNSDLLVEAKATFFEYAPPFLQGVRSCQVVITIYVFTCLALLAQGIRVLIQYRRSSSP